MSRPLVTVICLCYNHASFVREAVYSVLDQTYNNIQLILIDDASEDNSVEVIEDLLGEAKRRLPEVIFVPKRNNEGNCRAFNEGLKLAKGKYVIDLAADDVLLPERVEEGIKAFEGVSKVYGVHFCDVHYIDANGSFLKGHYQRNASGELTSDVPQGDVFKEILRRYYICSPSMMVKKEVFDKLQGYDPALAYEDFDFWVRSAREFRYCYTDMVLVLKRELPHSLGKRQYSKSSPQLYSTYLVCEKVKMLVRNEAEKKALVQRVNYEFRQAAISGNKKAAKAFYQLLKELSAARLNHKMLMQIARSGVDILSFWKRLVV